MTEQPGLNASAPEEAGANPPADVLRLFCTCGQKMRIPERKLGKLASCVTCGRAIHVPQRSQIAPGATIVYMRERAESLGVQEPPAETLAEDLREQALDTSVLEFYGFSADPFDSVCRPEAVFETRGYKEALAALTYGVSERKGFITIVGDAGTGKTTLIQDYLRRNASGQLCAVCLFEPHLSLKTRLERFLRGLDWDVPEGATAGWMFDQSRLALQAKYTAGVNVVLILDRAETIPAEMLEQLRMLGNIETLEEKVLQIVMVGRTEFEETLNLHELRPLRQRIVVKARMTPYARSEARDYVRHRLAQAGGNPDEVFTRGAILALAGCSAGVPSAINAVGAKALREGCVAGVKPVTARLVRKVGIDGKERISHVWQLLPLKRNP